jgi:hypothetical protein
MAKVKAEFDSKKLSKNLKSFNSDLRGAVRATVDRRAALTTTDLKTHAPWTDRTGAARTGLFAIPISLPEAEEIFMAYSVTYGIFLENANDGRYAVITPVMRIAGEALMKDLNHLIDRMKLS